MSRKRAVITLLNLPTCWRITVLTALAISFQLLSVSEVTAGSWRRSARVRQTRPPVVSRQAAPMPPRTYSRHYYGTPYTYPKYTGGFHARYFDGIPSIYGTRPLRGTAW